MQVSGSYGQLELLRVLAVGETVEVFLAQRADAEGTEGLAVVKRVLPAVGSEDDFVRSFLDEAGVAGRVKHPSIVKVIDLGEYEGMTFVATEYVPGGSVADLIDRRKGEGLPLGDALHIVARACEGLEHAFTAEGPEGEPLKVVHGALKPTNVLLSIDGEVRLSDFGMGRARAALALPAPDPPPPSMAPEQVRGEAADLRSDIYACGALLHLLATGRPPGGRERGGADLPGEVRSVVDRAMAPDPKDRFPSHSAMLAGIARAAAALGVRGDSRSLTAIVRRAVAVLGATAPVVDAVASAPPAEPAGGASGQAAELAEPFVSDDSPTNEFGVAEVDPTAGEVGAPPEPPAATPPPPIEGQEPPSVTDRYPSARKPAAPRSQVLIVLVVVFAALAMLGLGAAIAAMVMARSAADRPAPPGLLPGPVPTAPAVWPPAQGGPSPAAPQPPQGTGESAPPPPPGLAPSPVPAGAAPAANAVDPVPPGGGALPPPPSTTPDLPSPAPAVAAHDVPTPPTGAAPAAPRARGYLTVLTRPYSRVFLDGRPLGTTPIIRREVPAGRHNLRLQPDGLPPRQVSVEITAGQVTQINQSFAPIPGR